MPSTRRLFLKQGGLSFVSLCCGSVAAPTFLSRVVLAAEGSVPFTRRKVLVTIFLRGGMDGLMAIPPLEDPELRRLRPHLFVPAARGAGSDATLDLDNGFGLHPALAPLRPLFVDGRLAVIHAVGSPEPTRSHFEAQDFMETGILGHKSTESGWLNRVVGELDELSTLLARSGRSPLRAVALTPALPRSFYGPEPTMAVANLRDLRLEVPGSRQAGAAIGRGFETLYRNTTQETLSAAGGNAFEALELWSRISAARPTPQAMAAYPPGQLGRSLRHIARLIRARVGLQVAFAESTGWDTHVQQGSIRGAFATAASDLARSISAFWHDLGDDREDVLVLTMTEFGRTVRENGSGGTDHGHGSCMFLLGNEVDGGKVHGRLPTLAPDNLYQGRDVPVTTDFRSAFLGAVRSHLGVTDAAAVFPGWRGEPMPVIRS